jgi:RHS repeat-associated protein
VRTDWIGRPVFATTSAGTVVWTAAYLPFGGVRVSTGTPIDLRFPGQWFQTEAGLHQNWMRDYDPTTGRYMQADPLGLVDGASVYGYAAQSPLRWTDPTGELIPQAGAAVVACLVSPLCRSAVGAVAYSIYEWLTDPCWSWPDVPSDAAIGGATAWGLGKAAAPVFRPNGPFRRGGWWSTGQNWRVGWGRKGGNQVFRSYDRWTGKHDWYDGGPL